MKALAATLILWAVLFVLLWLGASERFYPPGDWIGAAVVSFFATLGLNSLYKAQLERRDARIVARRREPRDGKRVAVVGTIEPLGELLTAPLSGAPCVLYDYEITHTPPRRDDDDTTPSAVVDRGGMRMAPLVIRTGERDVRLLAYPGIENFEPVELDDRVVSRARSYIAKTQFQEGLVAGLKQIGQMLEDRSGCFRMDSKNSDYDDLERSGFKERHVPPHIPVCVVGLYSAKDNAIVPQQNVGGVRLIRGDRREALADLRAGRIASIVFGVLLIAVPAAIGYGLLSVRERYLEEHNQPSVKSTRTEGQPRVIRY